MEKQFVTYEIALKLKELGFNEECLACYTPHLGKGIFELISKGTSNEKSGFNERFIKAEAINGCAAPLWQQVIDWFREKQDLFISINKFGKKYGFRIESDGLSVVSSHYWDYNKAREAAILKAIELCQNKK